MARLYNEYKGKPLEMAAINVYPQFSQQAFMNYMRQHNGGDHVYIYDQGAIIARSYEVGTSGITVLVDREGRIARRVVGTGLSYDELKNAVDQLLQ
jgi:hypothetical protein